jgi:hypothetical protein
MPGGAGYFCDNDAPAEIIRALEGGVQTWRRWCVDNPTRIEEALRLIYPQHTVFRDIAREELQFYENRKNATTAESANNFAKWAFWAALASAVIGLAQCFRH